MLPKRLSQGEAIGPRAVARHLPAELTLEVFLYLRQIWSPRREGFGQPSYTAGWMAVLHVCAFWRRVALSAPTLWRDVNVLVIHPDYAREILARSAGLDLRLSYADRHLPYTYAEGADEHMLLSQDIWFKAAVFRRLETLDIACDQNDGRLRELLSQEAPKLRQLVYFGAHNARYPPENMLGATFPCLSRLSLAQTYMATDSPLFAPTLTHLKLERVHLNGKNSLANLLSVLSALPALEHLSLHHEPPYDYDDSDGSLPTVSLPKLQHMSLFWEIDDGDGISDSYVTFLQHLSIPPSAEIVTCGSFDPDGFQDDEEGREDAAQVLSFIFTGRLKGELQLELDMADCKKWHLYRYDPVAKARVPGRRMDIPVVFDKRMGDLLLSIINAVNVQSFGIGPKVWERLLEDRSCPRKPWVDVEEEDLWNGIDALWDRARCLSVCYCGQHDLWTALCKSPRLFEKLDTIVVRNVARSRDDAFEDKKSKSKAKVHECKAETSALATLVPGLMYTIPKWRGIEVKVPQVRIEGPWARWGGWDSVRAVFGDLDMAFSVPASDNVAPHERETYTLVF